MRRNRTGKKVQSRLKSGQSPALARSIESAKNSMKFGTVRSSSFSNSRTQTALRGQQSVRLGTGKGIGGIG